MSKSKYQYRWEVQHVNSSNEHIKISFSDLGNTLFIAKISPPQNYVFSVEFVNNEKINEDIKKLARKSIDFYLIELQEKDPWLYAKYHCTTASNIYSKIHWSYFP